MGHSRNTVSIRTTYCAAAPLWGHVYTSLPLILLQVGQLIVWTCWWWCCCWFCWCRRPGFKSITQPLKCTQELGSHLCVLCSINIPLQYNVTMGEQREGLRPGFHTHSRRVGPFFPEKMSTFYAKMAWDNDEVLLFSSFNLQLSIYIA